MNTYQCPVCGKEFKKNPKDCQSGCCSKKCWLDPKFIFWKNVQKTENCWLWTGCIGKDGYGKFGHHFRHWRAHRFSWFLVNGPIPEGRHILHRCDNPPCVRPDHLWLGSELDNVRDCMEKGRRADAFREVLAKLDWKSAEEIRKRYIWRQVTQKMLAAEYGVSRATIGRVVNGEAWTHIQQTEPE